MARAAMIKKEDPDCGIVFIGPCLAKKQEAMEEHTSVDYVLTFEELAAMMISKHIYLREISPEGNEWEASLGGRNFAQGGGVANAVMEVAKSEGIDNIKAYYADGANECKKQLLLMKVGRFNFDILEGMSCEGGCINGPCGINDAMDVKKRMNKENETHKLTITESLERMGYESGSIHVHRTK